MVVEGFLSLSVLSRLFRHFDSASALDLPHDELDFLKGCSYRRSGLVSTKLGHDDPPAAKLGILVMYKARVNAATDFRRQIISLPTSETRQDLDVDAEEVLDDEGNLVGTKSFLGLDKR